MRYNGIKKMLICVLVMVVLTSCKTKLKSKDENYSASLDETVQDIENHEDKIQVSNTHSSDELIEHEEDTMDNEKQQHSYEQISQQEAKNLMETEENYIILDVRTKVEYDTSHIKNAILLPLNEIKEKAEEVLPDKQQLILVYCRSGVRSKQASEELAALGYTNIKEFGGIID